MAVARETVTIHEPSRRVLAQVSDNADAAEPKHTQKALWWCFFWWLPLITHAVFLIYQYLLLIKLANKELLLDWA